jgi:hypothetical protein
MSALLNKYPFGVKCRVCCKFLKRSEALKFVRNYGETEQPNIVRFFHQACYKQVSKSELEGQEQVVQSANTGLNLIQAVL